jgi:hypothetical protein
MIEELENLNKLFANRYSDEDIQMGKSRSTSPPIIDDWDQGKNSYGNQRHHYSNHRYQNHYQRDRSRSPTRYYHKHR